MKGEQQLQPITQRFMSRRLNTKVTRNSVSFNLAPNFVSSYCNSSWWNPQQLPQRHQRLQPTTTPQACDLHILLHIVQNHWSWRHNHSVIQSCDGLQFFSYFYVDYAMYIPIRMIKSRGEVIKLGMKSKIR
jgi:hypothetical protein